MATHQMMKKQIADLDVPEVPEFLELIVGSGGHLWACRMSADMNHLTEDDLYEGVEGIISPRDFIEITEGAQLLFIWGPGWGCSNSSYPLVSRTTSHRPGRGTPTRNHSRAMPLKLTTTATTGPLSRSSLPKRR